MSLCSFFKICIEISQYYELKLISLYESWRDMSWVKKIYFSNRLKKKHNLKQVKMCWRFSVSFPGKGLESNCFGKHSIFFFSQKNCYPVVGMTAPEDRKALYRVLKESYFVYSHL